MQNAIILSCGAYAPAKVVPNSYFNEQLGEDVSTWLEEKVQIFERRWCAEDESTADLAEKAALQTLERGGIEADKLDLIIVATDTPEFISPSTASVIQHRIGASNAGTFDVNSACAGFVTALDMGAKYIQADEQYQHVLVIGAYAMSKHLNLNDKKTVTLFADGAGAVLLKASKTETKGFLASELISKGQYNEWMGVYGGGTNMPVNAKVLENHDHELKFVRRFPSDLNASIWTEMVQNLCKRIEVKPADVDQFFITQINVNSIFDTLDRLDVPREKGHKVMHNYGYTGSACIPMAFNDAWEKGLLKEGDLVFFIGSGGGLAFASAAFRL
ncbi:MAG: ketoacyl-ACP synthase III [Chitinophagales bacterium]